jgi:CubicO group peptidase (beta-lactamase class C family)
MRYTVFLITLLVLALAGSFRMSFAPERGPFEPATDVAAALDASLGNQLLVRGVPGASVAVIRDGEITDLWASGVTTNFTNNAVTPDTVFEVASLSKPLTAYAILRLAQQGQIDLDAPITLDGQTFTTRQALSHTAGFDNNLSTPPTPDNAPGAFEYAGTGYLWLGTEIERITGQTFQTYMNTVILPELEMTNSHFGRADSDDTELASPHMSVAMPFLIMAVCGVLIALPLLGLHGMARRVFGFGSERWGPRLIIGLGMMAGILAPRFMFGAANYPQILATNLVLLAAVILLFLAFRAASGTALRIGAVLGTGLLALVMIIQPSLPLQERRASFLPAAGLRTTANDYARFLTEIMAPNHLSADLAEQMLTPHVEVNADQDWALGLSIQRGEHPVIWHWGVNFPGYQAFALAWPDSGDGMVVIMNGGSMAFSLGGLRYGGLELARESVIAVQGGEHSGYWHNAH